MIIEHDIPISGLNMRYVRNAIKQFEYYKYIGEKVFEQVEDCDLFWRINYESNSIATIVKHLFGDMVSRFSDFLISDGEKPWRDRDAEFENDINSRATMMLLWDHGWDTLLKTLRSLQDEDCEGQVYICNEKHSTIEAINVQLAHYPYHIGQIVVIGKMRASVWASL